MQQAPEALWEDGEVVHGPFIVIGLAVGRVAVGLDITWQGRVTMHAWEPGATWGYVTLSTLTHLAVFVDWNVERVTLEAAEARVSCCGAAAGGNADSACLLGTFHGVRVLQASCAQLALRVVQAWCRADVLAVGWIVVGLVSWHDWVTIHTASGRRGPLLPGWGSVACGTLAALAVAFLIQAILAEAVEAHIPGLKAAAGGDAGSTGLLGIFLDVGIKQARQAQLALCEVQAGRRAAAASWCYSIQVEGVKGGLGVEGAVKALSSVVAGAAM